MLTNDILKVPTTEEWAVYDANRYRRSRAENEFTSVNPSKVVYGKRVSGIRYALQTRNGYNWSTDQNDFIVSHDRSYGFLVEVPTAGTTDVRYYVVKPSNFVAPRAEYDGHWIPRLENLRIAREEEAKAYAIRQEKEDARRAVRNERHAQAEPEAKHTAEVLLEAIREVLGASTADRTAVKVHIDGEWLGLDTDNEQYRVKQFGTVTMELRDVQRLLEKAIAE